MADESERPPDPAVNAPVGADVQAFYAAAHGLTLDDNGNVLAPTDIHSTGEMTVPDGVGGTKTFPAGTLLANAGTPLAGDALLAHIGTLSTIPAHELPPHVDPATPAAQEFAQARHDVVALEAQLGDDTAAVPKEQRRSIHDRYARADAWLQGELAAHRRSVQLAHGQPIGPDQTFGSGAQTTEG